MAVTFSVDGSRTSEYRLDPRGIIVKPELNGRHILPEIESLIQDMLSMPDGHSIKGQTTPVIIRKDGDKPVLVAGHRRLRAVLEINKRKLTLEPMLLRCSYMQLNEIEALAVAVTENRERVEIGPLDEAYCIKQFLRLGKDHQWIAQYGGFFPGLNPENGNMKKAIAWIKKREKLLGLTPEAEKALTEGKIKTTAAEHLAKLEADKQRELIESGNVSRETLDKANGKKRKATWKEIKTEILMVTNSGKLNGKSVSDEVVDWLLELVK